MFALTAERLQHLVACCNTHTVLCCMPRTDRPNRRRTRVSARIGCACIALDAAACTVAASPCVVACSGPRQRVC